ncbi:hypothetical protein ACWEN6_29950 [Sphaerisporangium sp. NPDC004334]
MQGNRNNHQPHYRCRYPAEYALANKVDRPKTVYLREAEVLPSLDAWLATEFGQRLPNGRLLKVHIRQTN